MNTTTTTTGRTVSTMTREEAFERGVLCAEAAEAWGRPCEPDGPGNAHELAWVREAGHEEAYREGIASWDRQRAASRD